MPIVNPEILTWARETAGLSLPVAAKRLGFSDTQRRTAVDRLAALEAGEPPSQSVLARMAAAYRRPLLVFFLPTPPSKGDRGQDFRTIPNARPPEESALVDALIRDVRARQSMLSAALTQDEDLKPLSFVNSRRRTEGIPRLLQSAQSLLGLTHVDYRSQQDANAGFNLLRTRAETAGVFVLLKGDLGSFHTAIDVEIFRGFALSDPVAPFIVINDRDARPAWPFTLLHELVHLLLGQTGVSGMRADNEIETFCNRVAGEFLLPSAELAELPLSPHDDFEAQMRSISDFARTRYVSSSLVAYKLYAASRITSAYWHRASAYFRELWLAHQQQQRDAAPVNYYTVRQHRVGKSLIRTVDRLVHERTLTETQAGKILGVRPTKIQALIDAA